MNRIEQLPKDIYYNDDLYQLNMWVTAFGHLCIGYRLALNSKHDSLFSVCVEPENEPRKIEDTIGYLNEYIGNTKTLDDACEALLNYIEKHKKEFQYETD